MADYPRRESHWAHKVIRLMMRVCAAQEIGSDACWLVTNIAHTEDAKRYTAPVTYWNDQLMSVLGFSWGKLDRARKRATEAGWLYYEPGGKGKVGKYWTTIPDLYDTLPDGAVDCDYPHVFLCNSGEDSGAQVEREPGENRGASAEHSTLALDLTLEDSCPEPPKTADAGPPVPSEFVFPTKGKGGATWTLPLAKLHEYREAFPGVNVELEIRRARQWCRDHPTKRKTTTGMLGFLTRWLGKEQNAGRNGKPDSDPTPFDN